MSALVPYWPYAAAFLAGVLLTWAVVRRRSLRAWLKRNPAPQVLPGREAVRFRVRIIKAKGLPDEVTYGPLQGANARKAFFDAMRHPGAVRVEFWDGDSLRSDWERD